MAFIRCCFIAVVLLCCISNTTAQTVYYPVRASSLLKATAADVFALLNKAIKTNSIKLQSYTNLPSSGIIFIYDSTITGNQSCLIQSNGQNYLTLKAAQDNGLIYGIYEYLRKLGFKFYQPGSIWEKIPVLTSPYRFTDTVFSGKYKYKSWFISGGHNRWIMDNNTAYGWDTYFGENGHNWALYQRRNGMLGEYRFAGHRGDILKGDYLDILQNNPCYIAAYNGERKVSTQAAPDIFNSGALQLWSNTIQQKYTVGINGVLSNPVLYNDLYRNYKYGNENIGIEVPDGTQWGNSTAAIACTNQVYPSESDQHFAVANYTAQKINTAYPDKKFQLYAYASHANIPGSAISINKNIDVQIIPTVYQFESSINGLRNRWYNKHSNISEYHYLNLSGWSGELPAFKWDDLKATLQIAAQKKSQGLIWEASPAKFGSLPYLLAANNFLSDGQHVDSTLTDFCISMFGKSHATIYTLLKMWGSNNTSPSRYTLPLYIDLLAKATHETKQESEIIKNRLRELKAYVHYMVLSYDLATDDVNKAGSPRQRDSVLCLYLAKTNKLQLVNSYYLITTIVSRNAANSGFHARFNPQTGTAYDKGNLKLITADEIDADFNNDVTNFSTPLDAFSFEEEADIKNQADKNNLVPLERINTKITYTNGANFYSKASYSIIASKSGNFTIQYTPSFEMKDKGYINFVVESADEALKIIKDVNVNFPQASGTIKVDLPKAGKYTLTIVSKYKSVIQLSIFTNGNYFYKKGAFLGSKTESYSADPLSLPGYFHLPNGTDRIYFTVNSFTNGKYLSAEAVGKIFNIKDQHGNNIKPGFVTPKDSTLYYLEIPKKDQGSFWRVSTVAQYSLQFVNISNLLWYLSKGNQNSIQDDGSAPGIKMQLFPNPSSGLFKCIQNGQNIIAEEITLINAQGLRVANFRNVSEFNISNLASGMYLYNLLINGRSYTGKIIKI